MPLFFFQLREGETTKGTAAAELLSAGAARQQASLLLRSACGGGNDLKVEVEDELGRCVAVVRPPRY
jgi:hypothetical protein